MDKAPRTHRHYTKESMVPDATSIPVRVMEIDKTGRAGLRHPR
ncbi:hypothetical protein [Paraburkholderia guartelaensis]|nr:hypothetical protein [Paraburkholderia guartelaensis]